MAAIRLLVILLFASFLAHGQATESEIKSDIDAARLQTLTPARVYNILDKINYGKQSIKGIYTATGTNTYAVTAGAGINNNDAGIKITIKFTNANTTGPATLNVNGLGALPLKTNLGSDHDVGGIKANGIYEVASTGTTWQVVGPTNEGGSLTTEYGEIGGSLPDQTDLYDTLNTRARRWYKVKTVSSNYTAALGDENNKLIVVNGGANFEIPKDADVDFPNGSALLTADSLETATYSKDVEVTLDTVDTHVWIKVADDRWITPRASSGSALTDGQGTTANGTAVDLGGAYSSDILIEGSEDFRVTTNTTGKTIRFENNDGGIINLNDAATIQATGISATATVSSVEFIAATSLNFTAATDFNLGVGDALNINTDPGTEGQVITSHGAGTPPTWEDASGGGGSVTSIATTSPITGGTITSTGTIGIDNAAADGSTKGAASFTANDFNATTGNISIDYTNGQSASASTKGFLPSADFTSFNSRISALTFSLGTSGTGPNVSGSPTSGATPTLTLNIPVMAASGVTTGITSNTTQTIPGQKTFPDGILSGGTVNGVELANTTGTVTFRNSSTSSNLGLSTTNNFFYTPLRWQMPGITFTTSGNTTDSNAATLTSSSGSGGGLVIFTPRFSSSASLSGFNVAASSSSSWSSFDYFMVDVGNSAATFNPSTGTGTLTGLRLRNHINASGGSYTVSGITYDPVETSLTGITHYGFRSTSTTARSGFGTASPTSILQSGGSFGAGYVAKTGAYTLGLLDFTVEVTSGTHTQTLPTAVGIPGRIYIITNSGSGVVTLGTTSSQTFVNVSGTPTTLTLNQFDTARVQSNGANWLRL